MDQERPNPRQLRRMATQVCADMVLQLLCDGYNLLGSWEQILGFHGLSPTAGAAWFWPAML
jgi:hypothetical protein